MIGETAFRHLAIRRFFRYGNASVHHVTRAAVGQQSIPNWWRPGDRPWRGLGSPLDQHGGCGPDNYRSRRSYYRDWHDWHRVGIKATARPLGFDCSDHGVDSMECSRSVVNPIRPSLPDAARRGYSGRSCDGSGMPECEALRRRNKSNCNCFPGQTDQIQQELLIRHEQWAKTPSRSPCRRIFAAYMPWPTSTRSVVRAMQP